MSDNNNNQNSPEMDFNEDLNNGNNEKKWSENPFEKEDNIYDKKDLADTTYNFSNEKIEADRKQNNGMAKILLVLLLGVGALITAVFGLMNKDFFKGKSQETTPEAPVTASATDNTKTAADDNNSTNEPSGSTNTSKSKLSAEKYCKLTDAQKYITKSISDLDKVLSILEFKIHDAIAGGEALSDNKVAFYKSKLEEISRAEADIRDFSEPYFDKDISVSYKSVNSPCKLADAPKYLYNWLEEIKNRMDALNGDLENVYASSDAEELATMPEDNAVVNPQVASKTQASQSSSKNSTSSKDKNNILVSKSKQDIKKVVTSSKSASKDDKSLLSKQNALPKDNKLKDNKPKEKLVASTPSRSNNVLNDSYNSASVKKATFPSEGKDLNSVSLNQEKSHQGQALNQVKENKANSKMVNSGSGNNNPTDRVPHKLRRCDSYSGARTNQRVEYYDDYDYQYETQDYYYEDSNYCD